MGGHVLLQGIFLTQGWNPRLLHRQVSSFLLSHQGSPLWNTRRDKKEQSSDPLYSQSHDAERKKSYPKEYVLYDSVYKKSEGRQKQSMGERNWSECHHQAQLLGQPRSRCASCSSTQGSDPGRVTTSLWASVSPMKISVEAGTSA